ncbi:MAG: cation diffusion facilitator family transporter [Pseudomonadota bacterium]
MPERMKEAQHLALMSVGIGLAVLVLKLSAWWITGSVALLSDALESVINVVAAGAALMALRLAARPPDDNHPWGHHKAEYLSAVFEGVLIVLAAVSIITAAVDGLVNPRPIEAPLIGLLVNGLATAINAVWGLYLLRAGRRLHSPALRADAHHVLTDVWTSAGVIVGLLLVPLTGWLWLDPVLAIAVALNILWHGYGLLREAAGGLMDEAPDPALIAKLEAAIGSHGEGAIEAHDIRTRQAGHLLFIDFHLVVPSAMTVAEAHRICDRIEDALRDAAPGDATITIHVEPADKAKQGAAVVF